MSKQKITSLETERKRVYEVDREKSLGLILTTEVAEITETISDSR